ncbi:MAG: hypothetical protein EOP84_32845, partial [Verrucomicrobiaceae bacterium]
MNWSIEGRMPLASVCALVLFGFPCVAEESAKAIYHQAPKPLAPAAVTSEWPRFLGPAHNASSPETKLLKEWPKEGLRKVWEMEKGKGWACPAIRGERLVLFHRLGNHEVIDCLRAETGEKLWSFDYAAPYQDRYGASDGPRTSPVIAEDRVYT